MFRTVLLLLVLLLPLETALAQECGPSCPACSGNSQGALLEKGSLVVSGLLIPTGEEERGVLSARYGILKWLDAGVGYTVMARKPIWSLRFQALEEQKDSWKPAILVGTGSVHTGGADQSVYVQGSKAFEPSRNFSIRASGGAAMLMPELEKVYGLAGLTANLFQRFSLFATFDGRSFHEGASVTPADWLTISAMLIESRHLAASIILEWVITGRAK